MAEVRNLMLTALLFLNNWKDCLCGIPSELTDGLGENISYFKDPGRREIFETGDRGHFDFIIGEMQARTYQILDIRWIDGTLGNISSKWQEDQVKGSYMA